MKTKLFKSAGVLLLFLFASCGGGSGSVSENKYLGKLPGLAEKYKTQMKELKQKAKEATDMNDAFKYQKEFELKKEEAGKAIESYMAENQFAEVMPVSQAEGLPFSVDGIEVTGASRTRVNMTAKVTINEDQKNEYGGWKKYVFGYIKAIDDLGNMIGKPTAMMPATEFKSPFKKGDKIRLTGSLGPLDELANLAGIAFITQDEYKKNK